MRQMLAVTRPAQRAATLSAAYVISCPGAAVPSFAAGLLTAPWGLTTVADAYGVLLLVLVIGASLITLTTRDSSAALGTVGHRA